VCSSQSRDAIQMEVQADRRSLKGVLNRLRMQDMISVGRGRGWNRRQSRRSTETSHNHAQCYSEENAIRSSLESCWRRQELILGVDTAVAALH
jgi:hypothetical protein